MPRTYVKKSDRGNYSHADMQKAVDLVMKNGYSARKAAAECGLNYKTVQRNVDKQKQAPESSSLSFAPSHRQIFSTEEETELAAYIKERSDLGYGLTIFQVRELAYDLAHANKKVIPDTWKSSKKAGPDWYQGFMKRHPELSARKPQQCSISRAAAFNKPVIQAYFQKLKSVIERNPRFADGSRVFNADETSTSTVGAVRAKIVSPKGVKQVHQIKGQERGTSVTTCFFVCAQGSFLPPVMIFPRKNVNPGMSKEAYPGTLTLANKSGWMTRDMFLEAIKHFIRHSCSSKDNPSLLIYDNVDCHLSIDVIRLCKENCVTLFTVPPHTTHKTQPLDVGCYGPFQNAYDKAVHLWTLNHPGVPATIYEVAGFVNSAACESMKPGNILSAFRKTDIVPFNDEIFQDHEFVKSTVTFIPEEQAKNRKGDEIIVVNDQEAQDNGEKESQEEEAKPDHAPEPSTSKEVHHEEKQKTSGSAKEVTHVTPKDLWGIPKLVRKSDQRKPRRKGKSAVLTDTPEKDEIERREKEKEMKEKSKNLRKREREEKALEKLVGKRLQEKSKPSHSKHHSAKTSSARRLSFSSSGSEAEDNPACQHSSSGWEEEEEDTPMDGSSFPPLRQSPKEGDYVLVEFEDKKSTFYYTAKVLKEEDSDGDLEVSYFRRSQNVKDKFCLPNEPDLKSVRNTHIKLIRPKPSCSGTKRQQNLLNFDFDSSLINVK